MSGCGRGPGPGWPGPVEVEQGHVGIRRPALGAAGARGAELGDLVAHDQPGLDHTVSSPPWEAWFHSSQKSTQRWTAATSASALPWPSAPACSGAPRGAGSPGVTTGSWPGRDAGDHVAAQRVVQASQALPGQLTGQAAAASGSGSKPTPGPYSAAARQRAAHAPCSPQPTMPTVAASSRASSWVATAAREPVRRRGHRAPWARASGRPYSGAGDGDGP